MADRFLLTVRYKGEDRTFEGGLNKTGYTYNIVMRIDDQDVFFEPDEERAYRARLPYGEYSSDRLDVELIKLIAEELEEVINKK